MDEKESDFWIRKYGWFLCFILSMLCVYVVLIYLGDAIDGEYSLIYGDLRHIYIPAIKNLCRDILNGESIYYSWNTSFGMNTSLYNAYYAYNPFNILYLIFYNSDDNLITLIIILIKVGMASGFFFSYIRKSHDVNYTWSIVFSLFYSMCSFQIAYNLTNIIWLDALWVLPAVFGGIDRIFKNGKSGKLILVYTYIFTTEFYMGYMIGVISLVYILGCFITKRNKEYKIIGKYLLAVLLAVGLSAWAWLPTLCFIINNNPVDATGFGGFETSILEFYRAFFCREISGIYTQCPDIYCGIPSIFLSIFFFISNNVKKRDKYVWGSMFILLILSCFIQPLYMFWHGFDNPDGWTYRFAYILCFVMCVMSAVAINKIEKRDFVRIIFIIGVVVVLYVVNVTFSNGNSTAVKNISINILMSILWICGIVSYVLLNNKMKVLSYIAIVVLAGSEIILAYTDQDLLVSDTKRNEHDLWNLTEKETVATLKNDPDFYRVNYHNDIGYNSGTYYGYNGISHFSSAENPLVRDALSKLGVASSQRIVMNHGLTAVTNMLFDIRYDVVGAVYKTDMTANDTYARIFKNDETLNIGYIVSGSAEDYFLQSKNAFDNNNQLLSLMTGEDIQAFRPVKLDKMAVNEKGVKLSRTMDGYMVEAVPPSERKGDTSLSFSTDYNENLYAYIYHEYPYLISIGFILAGGYENAVTYEGKLSLSYIKPLLKDDDKSTLKIIPVDNAWRQSFEDIFFAELDKTELDKAFNNLNNNQLIVQEYHDGYVKGTIDVPEDRNLLFTSIPYDKGWSVWVNGKKGDIIPIFNKAFLAVALPEKGENVVEFRFKAIGAETGIIMSLMTLIILVLIKLKKRENHCLRIRRIQKIEGTNS